MAFELDLTQSSPQLVETLKVRGGPGTEKESKASNTAPAAAGHGIQRYGPQGCRVGRGGGGPRRRPLCPDRPAAARRRPPQAAQDLEKAAKHLNASRIVHLVAQAHPRLSAQQQQPAPTNGKQ